MTKIPVGDRPLPTLPTLRALIAFDVLDHIEDERALVSLTHDEARAVIAALLAAMVDRFPVGRQEVVCQIPGSAQSIAAITGPLDAEGRVPVRLLTGSSAGTTRAILPQALTIIPGVLAEV